MIHKAQLSKKTANMVIDQNNDWSKVAIIHKDQLNRQLQVMAIRTHMQVYGKASHAWVLGYDLHVVCAVTDNPLNF